VQFDALKFYLGINRLTVVEFLAIAYFQFSASSAEVDFNSNYCVYKIKNNNLKTKVLDFFNVSFYSDNRFYRFVNVHVNSTAEYL
jgi:hypothetical protein